MVVQESTSSPDVPKIFLDCGFRPIIQNGLLGPIFFFNAVHFRRDLTCTLGLTNDLIDGDLASLYLDGV